jgi:hypothetical protein
MGDTWDDALHASDDYKNGDATTRAQLETGVDLLKVVSCLWQIFPFGLELTCTKLSAGIF